MFKEVQFPITEIARDTLGLRRLPEGVSIRVAPDCHPVLRALLPDLLGGGIFCCATCGSTDVPDQDAYCPECALAAAEFLSGSCA